MNTNQPPANVEEIHYTARGSDGKLWLDETVNLTDHACPFSERYKDFKTIKACNLQTQVNQVKDKPRHEPVMCFPRAYITSYHDCPTYKKESK